MAIREQCGLGQARKYLKEHSHPWPKETWCWPNQANVLWIFLIATVHNAHSIFGQPLRATCRGILIFFPLVPPSLLEKTQYFCLGNGSEIM